MAVPVVAAELRARERKHRPKPLSPAVDQVMRKLGNHLDFGHGLVENYAVDSLEIVGNQFEERPQLLARLANIFQWYDTAQVGPH